MYVFKNIFGVVFFYVYASLISYIHERFLILIHFLFSLNIDYFIEIFINLQHYFSILVIQKKTLLTHISICGP